MTAEELYQLRVDVLGWTQEELGRALGTTGKQISRWERGLFRIPELEGKLILCAAGSYRREGGSTPIFSLLELIARKNFGFDRPPHLSPATRHSPGPARQ